MTTKNFNGKAIYQPKGKAAEYAEWACNFYVGCSNGCEYCYCKKGLLAKAMGDDTPTLKKCFKDENHALEVFEKELVRNIDELQKRGLFFSFTSDWALSECIELTMQAIEICDSHLVPVKTLTKRADWVDDFLLNNWFIPHRTNHIAFGFTLTGHDDLEPNASTNAERIGAMRKLHEAGFKTWASVEPVIDFESSFEMIRLTSRFCNLYKVGLESGRKYDKDVVNHFVHFISGFCTSRIYFKDSLLKQAGINRSELPSNCVSRDYSLFND